MSVLKDIFVSYEIAKKLKEIGFDEKCIFRYIDGELSLETHEKYVVKNCVEIEHIINFNYNLFRENNITFSEICSAPTYEQVFKWFREKGIDSSLSTEYSFYYYKGARGDNFLFSGTEDTYEQAREQLILKLIETYKNEE